MDIKRHRLLIASLLFLNIACTENDKKVQECDCLKDYKFVVNYTERNLPAFVDNVTSETRNTYENFKEKLHDKIETITSRNECVKYLTYYVEYFKDNHTTIRTSNRSEAFDENNTKKRNDFLKSNIYQERETIELKESDLQNQYSISDIRGFYQTQDSLYTVVVIPNKTEFRDYIGVVVDSKTKLWEKGQVKFELREKERGVYEGFFYSKYHLVKYKTTVTFNNGIIDNLWFKTLKNEYTDYSVSKSESAEFKIISDSISYLRISSFGGEYSKKLDSLYKSISPIVMNTPYLIIDVRDNGGGNDANAIPLIPFFYTHPIIDDEVVELYATKDIIKLYEDAYEDVKNDSNYTKESKEPYIKILAVLKDAKLNTFVPQGEEVATYQMEATPLPKKVAILYNKGCASSCETLLFLAKESDKLILVGENSGGYVGYGNIFGVNTPNYKITLSHATTKYSTQWQYEVIGIAPHYPLDYNKDWVQQTIDILLNE